MQGLLIEEMRTLAGASATEERDMTAVLGALVVAAQLLAEGTPEPLAARLAPARRRAAAP